MRFVSVVTSVRSLFAVRSLHARQEVVDLPLHGPDEDRRVEEAGRAEDLLDDLAARLLQLVRRGRRRDEEALAGALEPLLELERPVVEGRREAEAVLDERPLARLVAVVHRPHLRDRLVALVDDREVVRREVVEERRGRLPRLAAGEVARVVLDPGAVPDLAHHLEVEARPLLEALGLEQLVLRR
jgi:hypothetical protein